MQIKSVPGPPKGLPLVLFLHESQTDLKAFGFAEPLKHALQEAVRKLSFSGKAGEHKSTLLPDREVPSIALFGLGKPGALAVEKLARHFNSWAASAPSPACVGMAPDLLRIAPADAFPVALRLLACSDYVYDRFMKEKAKEKAVQVLCPLALTPVGTAEMVKRASALREGYRVARDLGHAPANVLSPEEFAGQASILGKKYGWKVEVLDVAALERLKLPGLVMVGKGSEKPPVLVRIRAGTAPKKIIIGKGVVFDSGGVSIKPVSGMDEMKYDKCGAAAVLGAMVALSELGRADGVTAYLPLAENLPGGRAFRPGDILTWPDGTSVEVMTTDAEGRLILADALCLAAKEKPEYILTMATLTGAMRYSLGSVAAGLFTRHAALRDRLLASAAATGEFCWELPLWEEFDEMIKGEISTLKNSTAGTAGSITAAAFLRTFAGEAPYAHLDIAYTAYRPSSDKRSKGPTGFGVALLTHALLWDAS